MMDASSFTVMLQCGGTAAEVTVQGTRTQLRFMQEDLYRKFHERFPWRTATIHVDGRTYDEFGDMPFLSGPPDGVCFVEFEDTTDVYWIDKHYRNPKAKIASLEDGMGPPEQKQMKVIPAFPTVA